MFLFGIMGYYFFGYDEQGDKENWGSFGIAFLSLFTYVTVSGYCNHILCSLHCNSRSDVNIIYNNISTNFPPEKVIDLLPLRCRLMVGQHCRTS